MWILELSRHIRQTMYFYSLNSCNCFFSFVLAAERDPRRKQVLEEPRPNISFVLCNACVTSPALVVLKDADIIAGRHLCLENCFIFNIVGWRSFEESPRYILFILPMYIQSKTFSDVYKQPPPHSLQRR